MFKEILLLLLGAILGNVDKIISCINRLIKQYRQRKRDKILNRTEIIPWLIKYYEKNKTGNELYDCNIGGFEKKIPFFSKPSWQFSESINDQEDTVLEYSETQNDFRVNDKIIRFRRDLGQELFNEPTLYLDRIEIRQDKCKLHAKKCYYYEMVSNLFSLEEETILAASKNKKTPIRDENFRTIDSCEKLYKKPFSLGCTVSLVLKSQEGWEIALHKRSKKTVTYGDKIAVIPSFGLSIPVVGPKKPEQVRSLLLYNFVKEYCEELFNYEEIIQIANTNRNDPYFFFTFQESIELINMINEGKADLRFLGFGFDLFNGTANIAMSAIIYDLQYVEQLKQNIKVNWEVKKDINENPVFFVDYRDEKLRTWLKEDEYQPGCAFTIAKTLELLSDIDKKAGETIDGNI